MRHDEAAEMMTRLMEDFGLTQKGWTFHWMNRKATLGLCQYGPMRLLLSRSFVQLNTADKVEQVCRHEIAHALAGPGTGHGPNWVAMAYQCGVINPKSRMDEAVTAKGRYRAKCPTCAREYSMHRRPKNVQGRVRYCPPCWRSNGHLPHDARIAAAGLTFSDTVVSVPRTPVREPVSAAQSAPSVTVAGAEDIAPNTYVSAPELAAAMGVEAKQLRSWLRRTMKFGWREFQVGPRGAYQFTAQDVRRVVRAWNEEH